VVHMNILSCRCLDWRRFGFTLLMATAILSLGGGCASFKYTPTHSHAYTPVANPTGLAIRTGQDLRPKQEIRPGWSKDAESIVANALADEVKQAQLFHRVKIHADSVNPEKYSQIVQFQVKKFECYEDAPPELATGRQIVKYFGLTGALLASGIPAKYISEVQIEFQVLDASTQQSVFAKTYSATRKTDTKSFQGSKPQVQQTSDALESVISQFVVDLTRLPLNQPGATPQRPLARF
jgi:hypothetical protein